MKNNKKLLALVLTALLLSCNYACDSNSPLRGDLKYVFAPRKTFNITAEDIKKINDSKLVEANNSFGTKLFLSVAKENLTKNTFISPASASIALQMAYNGADNKTKDEMAKALEIEKFSLEELNSLNKLLGSKLSNPAPDITLNVANSLWADDKRVEIYDKFKKDLETFYDANAKALDFSDKKSADIINQWCEDKTFGKIKNVVDPNDFKPISGNEQSVILAYLMNAIYFKADWNVKFKKENTQARDFTLADGKKVKKDFMSNFTGFSYYDHSTRYENQKMVEETNKFEAARVDYGKDSKLSLYMFLPSEGSSLEKFYADLTSENIDTWINNMYSGEGQLSFPKFKMKQKYDLIPSLKKQGMNAVFDGGSSDLTKLGKSKVKGFDNIFVSKVNQDVFIDVNEEGSEAAAVTTVETSGAASAAPQIRTIRFVADRPFFYIIRDNETKSNLFMGSVTNPEYN